MSDASGEKTPPPGPDAKEKSVEAGVDTRVDRPTEKGSRNSDEEAAAGQRWDPKFEVQWEGEDDPDNPRSMSSVRKWLQVLVTSSTATCVTCTSSGYTSTYDQMMAEFAISQEVATLGLSLFVFALGFSPMLFAPMSEFYGRRPIYLISMGLFVVWLVPCAVAPNIQTMLVARFFNGLVGSAFLSVAGGTVGDLFGPRKLQLPMMFFTSAPFLGPIGGPMIAGFINYYLNWRWTYYVFIIWSFVQWALVVLFLPETFHPVLLKRKASKLRKETGNDKWHAPIEKHQRSKTQTLIHSCYRPFLLLVREPMCLNLCLLSAVLLAIIYLFFGAYPLIFGDAHGLNLWQVGLTFSGIGVGMIAAVTTSSIWQNNYFRKLEQYRQETGSPGASEPEFRLPAAIVGGPCCVIGMFWFAFTTYSNIHWIVPILGSVIFGFGVILVYSGVFTFLVDAYPQYAASALAANSFTRSTAAAAFPLFGVQMYQRLGNQWATALLAFLCLALAPFPYIFYKYGKRIRQRSKFAADK